MTNDERLNYFKTLMVHALFGFYLTTYSKAFEVSGVRLQRGRRPKKTASLIKKATLTL
jgi:hypothetical protein